MAESEVKLHSELRRHLKRCLRLVGNRSCSSDSLFFCEANWDLVRHAEVGDRRCSSSGSKVTV